MQDAPPRLLLTSCDRGPGRSHHREVPSSDQLPILRLLGEAESVYTEALVFRTPDAVRPTEVLLTGRRESMADVRSLRVDVAGPTDYQRLFEPTPFVRCERTHTRLAYYVGSSGNASMRQGHLKRQWVKVPYPSSGPPSTDLFAWSRRRRP